jgi:hypothetical protein
VPPVRYELGFYIPEDDTLHSHRREHLKSCIIMKVTSFAVVFSVIMRLFRDILIL